MPTWIYFLSREHLVNGTRHAISGKSLFGQILKRQVVFDLKNNRKAALNAF